MGGKNGSRKKSGVPGTEGVAEAWDAAAKEQGKLPLTADDEVRVDLELPTALSADGVALAARQAAHAQARIDARDKEIAGHQLAILELKKKIKDLRGENDDDSEERKKRLREVETGSSWGLVPCIEVRRYPHTVVTFRVDPETGGRGEKVGERAMTDAERKAATFEPLPVVDPPTEAPAES